MVALFIAYCLVVSVTVPVTDPVTVPVTGHSITQKNNFVKSFVGELRKLEGNSVVQIGSLAHIGPLLDRDGYYTEYSSTVTSSV